MPEAQSKRELYRGASARTVVNTPATIPYALECCPNRTRNALTLDKDWSDTCSLAQPSFQLAQARQFLVTILDEFTFRVRSHRALLRWGCRDVGGKREDGELSDIVDATCCHRGCDHSWEFGDGRGDGGCYWFVRDALGMSI